jgi:hypothetical protein
MNPAGLSLEQAPPFSVPLRFFLTAPWFLVLAAAADALGRAGDLRQPLAAGHACAYPPAGSRLHGAGDAGRIAANPAGGGGRHRSASPLDRGADSSSADAGNTDAGRRICSDSRSGSRSRRRVVRLGLAWRIDRFHIALWRAPVASGTVIACAVPWVALLVTVSLGLLLAGSLSWGWHFPVVALTDLHAVWGLAGWTALLLVAGVAYQVVPMFQMTPPYPSLARRGFCAADSRGAGCGRSVRMDRLDRQRRG